MSAKDMSQAVAGADRSQHAPVAEYEYEPLPSPEYIRILTLAPAETRESPLACDLERVRRGRNSRYTALSYSWATQDGNSEHNHSISIRNMLKPVTKNLFEALIQLRQRKNFVRLWVDAVCINQQDNDERSSQVQYMATTYSQASSVVAWLGNDGESQNAATLKSLLTFVSHNLYRTDITNLRCHWRDVYRGGRRSTVWTFARNYFSVGKAYPLRWTLEDTLDMLTSFVDLRYFGRRWIVQELAHADKTTLYLQWGQYRFECAKILAGQLKAFEERIWLPDARSILHRLQNDPELTRTIVDRLLGIQERLHAIRLLLDGSQHRSLPRLLQDSSRLECSLPVDKLYSLVSIDPNWAVIPDYTLSAAEAYVQFARSLWAQGHIGILSENLQLHRRRSRRMGLPSWAPDLRNAFSAKSTHVPMTGHLRPNINDENILTYRPRFLGTVCSCIRLERLNTEDEHDQTLCIVFEILTALECQRRVEGLRTMASSHRRDDADRRHPLHSIGKWV